MSVVPSPETRAALIARVKAILLTPKEEWPKIAAEPATVADLYRNYVVYLAAVPVLCTLIGSLVFGYGFGGFTYRPPFFSSVTMAILQYAMQLGGVYVFALIIDALAPASAVSRIVSAPSNSPPIARRRAGSRACSISCRRCTFSLCSVCTVSICSTPAFPS